MQPAAVDPRLAQIADNVHVNGRLAVSAIGGGLPNAAACRTAACLVGVGSPLDVIQALGGTAARADLRGVVLRDGKAVQLVLAGHAPQQRRGVRGAWVAADGTVGQAEGVAYRSRPPHFRAIPPIDRPSVRSWAM